MYDVLRWLLVDYTGRDGKGSGSKGRGGNGRGGNGRGKGCASLSRPRCVGRDRTAVGLMVVRFVCVIRVPVCPVCVPAPPCVFLPVCVKERVA